MKGKSLSCIAVLVIALAICLLAGPGVASSALTVTPRISIRYVFNDNLYAVDEEYIDAGTASYLDYLVGVMMTWRDGKNTFELSGDLGYEQFIDLGGWFDDMDMDPEDFSYVTGLTSLRYRYAGRVVTFEFTDNFSRSRDLQNVFGLSTDALGYWSLSTHNLAKLSLRYAPTPRFRNIFNYYYDTLYFDEQEDVQLFDLANSSEHRFLYRGEYDFTAKTTGIIDFQVADRTFSDLDTYGGSAYRIYQGLGGVRFNLRERTYLEMLGGYAMRDFYKQSDAYDLEESGDGIGRINFSTYEPKRYSLELYAERGISLYGNNIFFVYNSAGINSRVWLMPKISLKLNGSYRQAIYDIERNDREWLWQDDRIDGIIVGNGAVQWDILEKEGEGTLTLEAGVNYQVRDSNIDKLDDYVDPATTGFWSYDTEVGMYYAQVTIKPTILFGNR